MKPAIAACSKCGTMEDTGLPSCCAFGGDWYRNCGDPGDANVDHTWIEGLDTCKG